MSDLQHALSLWRSRQSQAAELEIKRILLAAPEDPAALRAMAEIYSASGRQREAAEVWGRLARILPADASVLRQLAQALLADGAVEQAVLVLMRAVDIDPDNARGFNNLGLARLRAGDPIGAVASLERAVAMDPSYAIAHMNLGMACEGVGRRADARASYQECLRIDPYLTPARLALSAMLRTEDPTASRRERDRALETHAINLMTQRRHDEAIPLWDQLIAEGADIDFLHGMRFHCQLYCCDWSDYDDQAASLMLAVKRGSRADLPFSFLVHSDDPDAQLRCSQIFVAARHPRAPQVATPPRAVAAARLRIGYLSFDFHEHATAYLIAGLLEAHDRAHFETIALSYGLHGPSPMRVRLEGAVDRFVDLGTTSDEDAAERIRELGIHILVDLKGFTGGARTGILARQPAPVQVNFLGYPGTMGADYVQYLVADRLLIQNVDERHYAEAVIFMPACYQPNDSRRPLPAQVPPRSEFGLPEHGFVFCCFNNLYKITPPTFDSWLDLLLRVPASVLWLLEGTQTAMHRLRSMAQSHGVASTRVVFFSACGSRHAPGAISSCRSVSRHTALQRAHDRERCPVDGRADRDPDRQHLRRSRHHLAAACRWAAAVVHAIARGLCRARAALRTERCRPCCREDASGERSTRLSLVRFGGLLP
jgi:predicted O-linked N-acetylglucosamine transferase (SPINDLY family)